MLSRRRLQMESLENRQLLTSLTGTSARDVIPETEVNHATAFVSELDEAASMDQFVYTIADDGTTLDPLIIINKLDAESGRAGVLMGDGAVIFITDSIEAG